jgi:CheY-like chemotaxis protein
VVPADPKAAFRYCPSCGEQVYTYTVVKSGALEVRCSSCGLALGAEASHPLRGVDCILIADDDRFFRTLVADLLVDRGLTANVIACESGATFLTLATERLLQGLPNKVAILDILMEPLDGLATAVAYRALEQALKVGRPTPLLFLSAVRYNETLKQAISHCAPALYLNKGADATPDKLGPRLERVLGHMLQQAERIP